jgi:hypothetical protein
MSPLMLNVIKISFNSPLTRRSSRSAALVRMSLQGRDLPEADHLLDSILTTSVSKR